MWDFSDYNYYDLLEIKTKNEELEDIGQEVDEDMMQELTAEILKKEANGYSHVVIFNANNNDTYEDTDIVIPLYEIPDDIKKFVKNTYDGVWEPVMDTISLFELSPLKIPAK